MHSERKFQFTHKFTKEKPHYTHRERVEKINVKEIEIRVRTEKGSEPNVGTLCIEPEINGRTLSRKCRKDPSYNEYWVPPRTVENVTDVRINLDYTAEDPGMPYTFRFKAIVKSYTMCFIATATYGTPLHPKLNILRDFRDEYLSKTSVGRALIKTYYKISPPFAKLISKSSKLRTLSKKILNPLVSIVEEN